MKTEEFIKALASDRVLAPPPPRLLARDLGCGAAIALTLFFVVLGLRPDLLQALTSPRFLLKPILTVSLLLAAIGLLAHLARPTGRAAGRKRWLLVAPLLLLAAVVVELVVQPPELWATRAIGHNSLWCLTMIPLLAVVPLACTLHALRQAAPLRPVLTGALAGLVAGSLAATFYAFHCPDDSPLFVAIWYVLALGVVTAAGAVGGHRLLRW